MAVSLIIGAAFTLAVVAPAKDRAILTYSAWVADSAEARGCLGPRGLYAELSTRVKPRVKLTELKRLAFKNKPSRAQLRIGDRRYPLQVDNTRSTYGNGQIIWDFKRIKLDQPSAAKLIGKRATISYQIQSKHRTAKPVKIEDGSCRAPF